MKMCTRILWFWQPVRGLKAVRASQSTSAGWEGLAFGGRRGAAPPPPAAEPILCLLPVASCLHPICLLCLTSEIRPDAPPPPYHACFGRFQTSHMHSANAAPPASQRAPLPLHSALMPTHSAGRALLLALCACPHQAAAANCEAGANCDAASWREDDELRRLSTSPEVLEAVSEDFGGDERVLAQGGGRCVALPAPLVSPRPSEPACVVRGGCGAEAKGRRPSGGFRDQHPFGSSAAQFVLVAPDVIRLHDPVVRELAGHRAVHSPTPTPEQNATLWLRLHAELCTELRPELWWKVCRWIVHIRHARVHRFEVCVPCGHQVSGAMLQSGSCPRRWHLQPILCALRARRRAERVHTLRLGLLEHDVDPGLY